MNDPTRPVDPAAQGRPLYNEADIGSGEKSPAEIETEEMIRGIPPLKPADDKAEPRPAGDTGQPRA